MRQMKFFFIAGLVLVVFVWCFSPGLSGKEIPVEKKLISLDFEDIELKDAIRLISVKTGINVIIDPEVKGKVSARFKRPIPVLKALSFILSPHGFDYIIEDNVIRVIRKPVELKEKTFSLTYALAEEVVPSVKDYLSKNGKVKLDPSSNSILVVDLEENIKKIDTFIQKMDTPSRQLKKKTFTLKYALAEDVASLVRAHLSEEGSLLIDKVSNSLIVEDTSANFPSVERLISSLDVFSPSERIFQLNFALAEEVAPSIQSFLSEKGKFSLSKDKNQIMVVDATYPLYRVKNFIESIDKFSLQAKEASFKANYIYLDELSSIISEYLSPQGKMEVDSVKETVKVKDASYPLSLITERVEKEDVFSPQKKIFKLRYASATSLSYKISDLLSDKGEVKVDKDTNSLFVVDTKKFLDKVSLVVEKEDRIERQLTTKKYNLLYLSAQEAKAILEPFISEFGRIIITPTSSERREKKEKVITIPQEEPGKSTEEKETPSPFSSQLQSVIYVTDLNKNLARIEKVIQELNSEVWASKVITRTFYIDKGSVERIALTIANMMGIPPEEVQGLQLKKGTWMQMQVSSPSIDLGNVGAIGKK